METKRELRDRLMGERTAEYPQGRWKAFCGRRAALEASGVSKEEAHRRAAEEFPPLKPGKAAPRAPLSPSVLRDAIEWVWGQLDERAPAGAPSVYAKKLHAWARKNRNAFFRTYAPTLLPTRTKGFAAVEEGPEADDGPDYIGEFERELEASGGERRSPAAPTPAAPAGPTPPTPKAAPPAPVAVCQLCRRPWPPGNPNCPGCVAANESQRRRLTPPPPAPGNLRADDPQVVLPNLANWHPWLGEDVFGKTERGRW